MDTDLDHATGRRHSIRLSSGKLRYWVYGPSQGAPVIVAVHGFRGTHHGLERIINHLPDYTVIVPDLPGFGESEPLKNGRHDIDGYAAVFEEFIPIVTGSADTLIVLGHSFGSIIAAKLAAESPLPIQKLILINPIARRPHIVGRLGSVLYFWIGNRLSEEQAKRYFAAPIAVNAMSQQLTKSRHALTRRYVKNQHLAYFSDFTNKQTLRESFKASVSATVGQYGSAIKIPTLLIAGAHDEIAPLKTQEKLYDGLDTYTELAVIKGVGHLVHYEKADLAADFIRAFIDDPTAV